jgi:hypothetical protein
VGLGIAQHLLVLLSGVPSDDDLLAWLEPGPRNLHDLAGGP